MSRPSSPRASRCPRVLFLADALFGRLCDGGDFVPLHHHDPVIVGDDEIAGAHQRPGTHHRHVHRAQRGFDGALRADRATPDGKSHLRQRANIPAAGVDDESRNAASPQRRRQQLAEITVGARRRGRDDEDVAGLAHFHRDVDHQVVARRHQDRDRRTGDQRARVDRPHVRREQSAAPLRLVHGRDAVALQIGDQVRRRPARSVARQPDRSLEHLGDLRKDPLVAFRVFHLPIRIARALDATLQRDPLVVLPEVLLRGHAP